MICRVCVCVRVRVFVSVSGPPSKGRKMQRLVIQLINQIIELFPSEFREDEKLFNLAAGQA